MTDVTEQALGGGNLSQVSRRGNEVLRPTGPWTPAVHTLLRHLEGRAVPGVPRVLGIEPDGRERLTFIEGEAGGDWTWTDYTLTKVGRWLRLYHDAVRDFVEPSDAVWRMCWAKQQPGEMICHFDIAPRNLVLRPDGSIGVIDWDVAAPGDARLDVGKAANSFTPLADETRDSIHRVVRRTRLLLDAYGWEDSFSEITGWMIDAAGHSRMRILRGADDGDAALLALVEAGVPEKLAALGERLLRQRGRLEDGFQASGGT